MLISTITQQGINLSCDTNTIPAQFSADLEFEFIKDSKYMEHVVTPFCAYSQSKFVECENNLKAYPLLIENGLFRVPKTVFDRNGYLVIAFSLSTEKETIQTLPIVFKIYASVGGANILPDGNTWQELVIRTVDDRISLSFSKPMNNLIEEAKKQQELAKRQQTTVATQQKAIDNTIAIIAQKLENGEFIPEHKWEGDILYFSNGDGTWDEGFKVPGMDALNWKTATCTENATYTATIENWGTVVNSLLAITFDTAKDKTKPVILKINDEEEHPILSNTEPMLGEELENKSTILRFDGDNWLVQTSQDGIFVTREELQALQSAGKLIPGMEYKTVEPAEELNINKDAFMMLSLKDNFVVTESKKYFNIPFGIENSQGDCLSFYNGGVRVGKGVNKIIVSLSIIIDGVITTSPKFVRILKNNDVVAVSYQTISAPSYLSISPSVLNVIEGDNITAQFYGEKLDILGGGNTNVTYLTAQVIGQDYTLGNVSECIKEIAELKEYIANNKTESGDGYIKYPDGTLVCYGIFSSNVTITDNFGNGFSGSVSLNIEFAKPFIDIPSCSVDRILDDYVASIDCVTLSKTAITKLALVRNTKLENAVLRFSYQAIGRWK